MYLPQAQYIEIYNEQVHDLLGNAKQSLKIRGNAQTGPYVEGLKPQLVSTAKGIVEVDHQPLPPPGPSAAQTAYITPFFMECFHDVKSH